MSEVRFLSGRMVLYLVARSTMNRPYSIPLMAVLAPNTMSICIVSPNFGGRSTGVVLRLDLSTVEKAPISWIGSVSVE